jgi:hypothetical protein
MDRTTQPVITAYPAGTPNDQPTTPLAIDQPLTRLTISY